MSTHAIRNVICKGCHGLSRKYSQSAFKRGYCSSEADAGNIGNISLSHSVPGLPQVKYASFQKQQHDTEVTILENGLRVASENKFGEFSTVGVVIDSGSRYEVAYPSGISHFLEKLSFSSTSQFDNKDSILQELEKYGGICDCQGSRDILTYAISIETKGLMAGVNILSEVILRPRILPEEMEDSKASIGFELEALNRHPNPEPLLMEMIHTAAYKDNTLGLTKMCPPENIETISKSILYTYMKNFHTPERMVLAGVGMEHSALVEAAREFFVKKRPTWLEDHELFNTAKFADNSLSQYTGGEIQVEKDLSDVSLSLTSMPELAHIVIGLESCSHKDDDFVPFCVLNMMMGGGGSFSAGGPGKGMYTRLYLNILNRHHWIHNATAYNHAYDDTGLFCIHGSAHPSQMKDLVEVISVELVNTAGKVLKSELDRAKRQLQSMLLMNLESRPVLFEDIARQVLANKIRHQPQYYYNLIDNVTAADIQRVATRMLRTKVSVAALGNLAEVPSYKLIQTALVNDGRLAKRFALFR